MTLNDIVDSAHYLASQIPSALMKVPKFLVGVDLHKEYQYHRNFCKEFITNSVLLAKRFEQSYHEEAREIMLYRLGPLIFSASFIAMAYLFESRRFVDLTLIPGAFILFGACKEPKYIAVERMLKAENEASCIWGDVHGLITEVYDEERHEGEEWKFHDRQQ